MTPARLLVIHDDVVAEIVKTALDGEGHQIELAFTAAEALAKFGADKYDLVFIGTRFSAVTGEDLARAIKQLAPSQLISIIPAPFLFQDLKEALAAIPSHDGAAA